MKNQPHHLALNPRPFRFTVDKPPTPPPSPNPRPRFGSYRLIKKILQLDRCARAGLELLAILAWGTGVRFEVGLGRQLYSCSKQLTEKMIIHPQPRIGGAGRVGKGGFKFYAETIPTRAMRACEY